MPEESDSEVDSYENQFDLAAALKTYSRMIDVPYDLQQKAMNYYRNLETLNDGSVKVSKSKYDLASSNETERAKYKAEIETARVLGDLGADILLLPESNAILMFNGEHSDSIIEGIWGEIKNPRSMNSIQHHFGKAMIQGDCLILDIDQVPKLTANDAARRINGIIKDDNANVDTEGKGVIIISNNRIEKLGIIKNGTLNWVPLAQVRTCPLLHLNTTIKEIIVNKKAKHSDCSID